MSRSVRILVSTGTRVEFVRDGLGDLYEYTVSYYCKFNQPVLLGSDEGVYFSPDPGLEYETVPEGLP